MITIIPAIDIIEGKCVRLTRGDFSTKKIYNQNPLEVAKQFADAGIRRLHLVDLDGARQGKIVNQRVLQAVAAQTHLQIDFGGGIRSNADVRLAFESGARQITAGSVAVSRKDMVKKWLKEYGADKIILGADVKDGRIAVSGWRQSSGALLDDFLREYTALGVKQIISTDVSRDGALIGPAFQLYQSIKNTFPALYVIASGGISGLQDVERLNRQNIDGVIIGKALYEGKIQLKELERFLC